MSSLHPLHSYNAIPSIISLVYAGLTTRIVIEHVHRLRNPRSTSTLSRRSLDLRRCPLRTLLARNSTPSLSTSCLASSLGLLCLPCALSCSLLLFPLLDRGLSGCGAGFWSLGAALFDHVQRGSNDSALVLHCAAGALFGDFLQSAMSQHQSVKDT